MSIKELEVSSLLFEAGLAIKLKKVPCSKVAEVINIKALGKIIKEAEKETEYEKWDGSHISPGEKLKALLEAHEITQAELARTVGVLPQKVNDLIHNRLTITKDWAKKIGAVLKLDYKTFL